MLVLSACPTRHFAPNAPNLGRLSTDFCTVFGVWQRNYSANITPLSSFDKIPPRCVLWSCVRSESAVLNISLTKELRNQKLNFFITAHHLPGDLVKLGWVVLEISRAEKIHIDITSRALLPTLEGAGLKIATFRWMISFNGGVANDFHYGSRF